MVASAVGAVGAAAAAAVGGCEGGREAVGGVVGATRWEACACVGCLGGTPAYYNRIRGGAGAFPALRNKAWISVRPRLRH